MGYILKQHIERFHTTPNGGPGPGNFHLAYGVLPDGLVRIDFNNHSRKTYIQGHIGSECFRCHDKDNHFLKCFEIPLGQRDGQYNQTIRVLRPKKSSDLLRHWSWPDSVHFQEKNDYLSVRQQVYEDTENEKPPKKAKVEGNKRRVLGEIKNTIITRSKSSVDINAGVENIRLNKRKTAEICKKPLQRKPLKPQNKKTEQVKKTLLPKKNINKRLSSIFNVVDYANEIHNYLRYLERKYEIIENPEVQRKFKLGTRLALLDWYVEMHEYVQMTQDTLQLSISIMDRYLQKDDSITKVELQLVALASAFVSSKYEEIVPIEMSDLIFVSDNAYSIDEIYNMEMKILRTLEYNFGRPVAANFIRRYAILTGASRTEESLALYFSEVALLSYELCYLKPSLIASAAFYLALCMAREAIDPEFWDVTLISHSKYKLNELEDSVSILAELVVLTSLSKYEALKRKYSNYCHQSVSMMRSLSPQTGIINRLIKVSPS